MSTLDEVRLKHFWALNNKFMTAMQEFKNNSEEDRAWPIIDARPYEIMDADVGNAEKAKAFDYVLNEIFRVHPRAHFAYCQALEKRLDYTEKYDDTALRLISKEAYSHRGDGTSELYKKIIAKAFQKAKVKTGFPNAKTAKDYLKQEKAKELKDDLTLLQNQIDDPFGDPVQKLNKVKEALAMLKKEKYLGPIQSNESKQSFCEDAVRICREELFDTKTADEYLAKAFDFKRRAANAKRKWAQRRNLWTDAQEQKFLQEFRSDGGR